MPLTDDQATLDAAKEVLGLLKGAFGTPGGYRPAHAKGILLEGTFTPTAEAKSLTKAYHFNASSVPVTVRFSDSTGIPIIPDNDANASPRGFAVRFHLPEENGHRKHTDVIGHSTPFFPVPTGQDFANLVRAIGGSQQPDLPNPTPIEKYLGENAAAFAFVTAPKPFPHSWATEGYFALNAFKFINAEGKETYIRYEIVPEVGLEHYSEEDAKALSANYLSEEIKERVGKGSVGLKVLAQIAEEGDPTNDITKKWPESREKVELGSIKLTGLVADDAATQKTTIFDPIPRVDGIVESDDPILQFRAALYLVSGRERRAA
jgi:catalase